MNKGKNKKIGIIIYANPDQYPPLINALEVLKDFEIILVARNQGRQRLSYPANVKVYRLGRQKSFHEKQRQSSLFKFLEYTTFILRTIFYIRLNKCRFIYACDAHAFIAGFIAARFGKKIPLLYHIFDLQELINLSGLSQIIKYFELRLARYADKTVSCDINRAKLFQEEAGLPDLPETVINAPLLINKLPENKLKEILAANGFEPNTRIILYQGLLNYGRSLLEVLDSMVYWPKDTVLVLMGEEIKAFMRFFRKRTAELDLQRRIIIIPFVDYSKIFYYTSGASLGLAFYSQVSYNQIYIAGASNKIYEYLSMGVPVVTNDTFYFRQALDQSMVYFAKQDSAQDIGRVINEALSDAGAYSMKSESARKAHIEKFNYQLQFKPILEFIREKVA